MRLSLHVSSKEEIDRAHFLTDYFDQRPLILRSIVSHWPAVRSWTPRFIAEKYGGLSTELLRYDPNSPRTFLEQTYDHITVRTTLADYLREGALNLDPAFAIREDRYIFAQDQQMIDDMNYFEPFCPQDELCLKDRYCSLWMGPRGHRTGLHADIAQLFLIQIFGSKRVLMFGREQTPYLYEERWDTSREESIDLHKLDLLRREVYWSRVDPSAPDYDKFPLFRHAEAWEVLVNPGDALYIPDGWWHWVDSISDTISVSFEIERDTVFRSTPPECDAVKST